MADKPPNTKNLVDCKNDEKADKTLSEQKVDVRAASRDSEGPVKNEENHDNPVGNSSKENKEHKHIEPSKDGDKTKNKQERKKGEAKEGQLYDAKEHKVANVHQNPETAEERKEA